MNIVVLQDKIEEIVNLLKFFESEAESIAQRAITSDKRDQEITTRELKLNNDQLLLLQREKELATQKDYIEKKTKDDQLLLGKILVEKEDLIKLKDERQAFEKEKLELELEKRNLSELKAEKAKFESEKEEFEKEKTMLINEKSLTLEKSKLLEMREKNIVIKEQRIQRIEDMTAV